MSNSTESTAVEITFVEPRHNGFNPKKYMGLLQRHAVQPFTIKIAKSDCLDDNIVYSFSSSLATPTFGITGKINGSLTVKIGDSNKQVQLEEFCYKESQVGGNEACFFVTGTAIDEKQKVKILANKIEVI